MFVIVNTHRVGQWCVVWYMLWMMQYIVFVQGQYRMSTRVPVGDTACWNIGWAAAVDTMLSTVMLRWPPSLVVVRVGDMTR